MKRRTKILLRSIVVMVIIIAGTLVALMSFDVFKQKYEFRSQTSDVLNLISSDNSKSIYEGASPQFKDRQNETRFKDLMRRLNHVLGEFESIKRVTRNERVDGAEGMMANVRYELVFSKAETLGEFSYIQNNDRDWRLLGFDVRIPELLASEFEKMTADPQRLSAPSVVLEKTKEIVNLLKKKKSDDVYDAASKIFRAGTTKERFAIALGAQERAMGKLKKLGRIEDTAQNEGKDSAHVDATIVFSNKETDLDIHFYKEDDEWRMSSFKVLIPEPKMPNKPLFKNK